MNFRERYIGAVKFHLPDKIPFMPGGPREKTLKRWREEGVGTNEDWYEALKKELSLPPSCSGGIHNIDVSFKMIPTFEEKVLEHKNGHYIVQDWMGAITEITDDYDYTYIRNAKDFVTRMWHKFPVECEADFVEMKKRFDADAYERIPEDFKKKCQMIRDRGDVLSISINGPFWQLREWCGFEGLCTMMIMQPEFVMEMMHFWKTFVTRMLHRVLDEVELDRVFFSEDMAYKAHSMISPEMTRHFLVPCYHEWIGILKNANVPVIEMDSDGYVDELIPIWIESKFDMCSPVEVAAHNDIALYRRIYKKDMAYFGGVDKRCIAKGGMAIVDEMNRLAPVIKSGGYIPSCDHGVPFDISWQDFIRYSGILGELTGWL